MRPKQFEFHACSLLTLFEFVWFQIFNCEALVIEMHFKHRYGIYKIIKQFPSISTLNLKQTEEQNYDTHSKYQNDDQLIIGGRKKEPTH